MREQPRKNKANSAWGRVSGVRVQRAAPRRPNSGPVVQTNPILGSRPLAAVVLMGETPMPRNALRRHYERGCRAKQTQFRPAAKRGKCLRRQELRTIHPPEGLKKTKPILRLRISDCGLGTDLPPPACSGQMRQTNPISGRMKLGTSAVRIRSCSQLDAPVASEKQSQFGQGAGIRGQGSAARAPVPELWAGCTNKANWG